MKPRSRSLLAVSASLLLPVVVSACAASNGDDGSRSSDSAIVPQQNLPHTRYTVAINEIEALNIVRSGHDPDNGYVEWAELAVLVHSSDPQILPDPTIAPCVMGPASSGSKLTSCMDGATTNGMFAKLSRSFYLGAADDTIDVGMALVNIGGGAANNGSSQLWNNINAAGTFTQGVGGAVTLGFGSTATGLAWAAGPIIGILGSVLSLGAATAQSGPVAGCSCRGGLIGNPKGGFTLDGDHYAQPAKDALDSMYLHFSRADLDRLTAVGPAELVYDVAVGYPPPWNTNPNVGWCNSNHRIHLTITRDWSSGLAAAPRSGDMTVAPKDQELDVYFGGNGPSITHRTWTPAAWTAETIAIDKNLKSSTPIAAINRLPGFLDVFYVGEDGAVGTAYNGGAGWNHLALTGPGFAPPHAPIAAVARTPLDIDVAVVDALGVVRRLSWSYFTGWSISNVTDVSVAAPGAGVAMVARTPDNLDIFYPDKHGNLATAYWHNGTAFSPPPLSPWGHGIVAAQAGLLPAAGNVTAVARMANTLDVFFVDTHGDVEQWSWTAGSAWSTAQVSSTGVAGATISAVSRQPDAVDVAYAGSGGYVYVSQCTGGAPRCTWSTVTTPKANPLLAAYTAPLSLVARTAANLDVFYQDSGARQYSAWWWTGAVRGAWGTFRF